MKKLTEDFRYVGTYTYKYISDDFDDYENKITEEEFDTAWETKKFPESIWLESDN